MSVKSIKLNTLDTISKSTWRKLASKKIYFGHQSVGFNIIDGMKDLIEKNLFIKLNVVETNNPKDFDKPILAHSPVGRNMDPKSKCDAFSEFIQSGIGERVDIAFFKFCYVDLTSTSDPKKTFNYYHNTLTKLQHRYPTVKFIPVTIPLVTTEKGIKTWIKKLLRRPMRGYGDNIIRNQFNTLLRSKYTTPHPVFDLSLFESTYPNGSRSFFREDNKLYFTLAPEYSYNGGHLNAIGRKHVAEQLLIFLATLMHES